MRFVVSKVNTSVNWGVRAGESAAGGPATQARGFDALLPHFIPALSRGHRAGIRGGYQTARITGPDECHWGSFASDRVQMCVMWPTAQKTTSRPSMFSDG